MKFEDLTPEQMEKAKACKVPEDILELAKEEGYELSDADLEAIGGGDWDCWTVCTGRCGRYNDCPHDRF